MNTTATTGRMIVARVNIATGEYVGSEIHAIGCGCKAKVGNTKAGIGRPIASAHADEIARATDGPCIGA